ncbi:MAG: MFS transporter [Pseudomonadota bacterium]
MLPVFFRAWFRTLPETIFTTPGCDVDFHFKWYKNGPVQFSDHVVSITTALVVAVMQVTKQTRQLLMTPARNIHMKVRWSICFLLFLTWLMSYIDRSLMPMAIPFIGSEFQIKPAMMGAVMSAFFLGYGLMQIPGGLIADRLGPRKTITFGITAWSIFSILTGVANSLTQLIWIRVLFGIGEGVHPPAAFKALSNWFKSAERARANGLVMSSNTIGPMIAPLLFATVMAAVGWRNAFILISIPGFLIALAVYWYLRDTPAEHPRITADELSEIGMASQINDKMTFRELFKYPALWKLFFIYMTWDVTWWGFQAWLPSYLLDRGFALVTTGVIAALPYAAGFIGLLLSAYISDRIKKRKIVLVVVLLGNAIGMLLTPTAPSATWAVVFLIATGFFLPAIHGPFWSLSMDLLPSKVMGYSTGFINTGGQIAGVASPIVIGALIQWTGRYEAGFIFMAISAAASMALVLTMKDPGILRASGSPQEQASNSASAKA